MEHTYEQDRDGAQEQGAQWQFQGSAAPAPSASDGCEFIVELLDAQGDVMLVPDSASDSDSGLARASVSVVVDRGAGTGTGTGTATLSLLGNRNQDGQSV